MKKDKKDKNAPVTPEAQPEVSTEPDDGAMEPRS